MCAAQALQHADESHSTLRFAQRAKQVVNNAVVNEVMSNAAVLKRQAREIDQLRRQLGSHWCVGQCSAGMLGNVIICL